MKKELFNIIFLGVIALIVAWLYWPQENAPDRSGIRGYQSYILALSWQPAFCESKPNKRECRSQHKRRYDANNFSLHGLWPQPRDNVYCEVSKDIVEIDKRGRWNELPRLELSKNIRSELTKIMPGYRSNLHRHEWFKHGTCMGDNISPQAYYVQSIEIMQELNTSGLRNLFAQNIGKEITSTQILNTAERVFGSEVRNRIAISCKRDGRRTLINGIKFSLKFDNKQITLLYDALKNAPKLSIGCKRGIVDLVGLQ